MDSIIDFFLSDKVANNLPKEVGFIFSIAVILGLSYLFFNFLFKLIKYYWETIRPNMKIEKEKEIENAKNEFENDQKIDRRKEGQETMQMIINLHDKIGKITSDYAGKFVTRSETNDIKDKITEIKEEISNIKGQMGIK